MDKKISGKQYEELKREIDSIKSQIKSGGKMREGSSSSGERTMQSLVLEQILKNVQEIKSSGTLNSPVAPLPPTSGFSSTTSLRKPGQQ